MRVHCLFVVDRNTLNADWMGTLTTREKYRRCDHRCNKKEIRRDTWHKLTYWPVYRIPKCVQSLTVKNYTIALDVCTFAMCLLLILNIDMWYEGHYDVMFKRTHYLIWGWIQIVTCSLYITIEHFNKQRQKSPLVQSCTYLFLMAYVGSVTFKQFRVHFDH